MKSKRQTAKTIAKSIDEYLAKVSDDQRVALEELRKAIRAAAPKAEECINYEIPTFRLNGRMLVSFAAWAKHCAFYPGTYPVEVHQTALKAYDTNKGTIRFPADKPLSAALVRKLVRTRIPQNAS